MQVGDAHCAFSSKYASISLMLSLARFSVEYTFSEVEYSSAIPSFIFLLFCVFGEPVLQIFGQYLHALLFHYMVDYCGRDF